MEQGIIDNVVSKQALKQVDDLTVKLNAALVVMEKLITAQSKGNTDTKQQKDLAEALAKINRLEEQQAAAKQKAIKLSADERLALAAEARQQKLNAQIAASAIGSYDRMSAQYSKNRILINSWTDAEIKNSKAKQQLIKDTNKLHEQMSNSQRSTGNATLDVGKYENALGKAGLAIKGLIVAGIALAAQFLKNAFTSSIQGAIDEEKSMQRLSFAIKKVGGGSDSDLALLAKQAQDLMGIFSHEEIEQAAVKMINFGLTVKQVHQLMPLLVDAAAASGKSLEDLATAVDKGTDSGVMARSALGQLGLAFKDTGSKAENYRIIQEGLTKFTGGNTDAMKSQWGTLQNLKIRWDEVKEALGAVLLKAIVPLGEGLIGLGRIWESTVDKIKGVTDRMTLGRMDDFKKELVGQKDKIKYIDQEITAERNLYKAQQNQIELNKQKISSNTAAGGAWLKNNKALEQQNAGLQIGVNRHIAYINALAGLKQELKEGTGTINLNDEANTKDSKAVLKLAAAYNELALQMEPAINAAKDMADSDLLSFAQREEAANAYYNMKLQVEREGTRIELKTLTDTYNEDKKTTTNRTVLDANYATAKKKILLTSRNAEIALLDEGTKMVDKIYDGRDKDLADRATETAKTRKDEINQSLDDEEQYWVDLAKLSDDNQKLQDLKDAEKQKNKERIIAASLDTISKLYDIFYNSQADKIKTDEENQLNSLKKQRDEELNVAGLTADQKQSINDEYDLAEWEAKKAAFEREKDLKKQAIIIDAAMGVVKIWAESGINVIVGGVLTALLATTTAASIAQINATQYPAFAEGGTMPHDGLAWVGDGGKHEAVITPQGQVYKTPNTPTLTYMEAGTEIKPDASILNNQDINKAIMLNVGGTSLDTSKLEKKLDKLIELGSIKPAKEKSLSLMEQIKIAERLKLN